MQCHVVMSVGSLAKSEGEVSRNVKLQVADISWQHRRSVVHDLAHVERADREGCEPAGVRHPAHPHLYCSLQYSVQWDTPDLVPAGTGAEDGAAERGLAAVQQHPVRTAEHELVPHWEPSLVT